MDIGIASIIVALVTGVSSIVTAIIWGICSKKETRRKQTSSKRAT